MLNLYELDSRVYKRYDIAKWKQQRIQEGICDGDTWSLDLWMLQVIPAGLRKLAQNTHSFPGNEEFPTHKSWTEWLNETAKMGEDIYYLVFESDYDGIEKEREKDAYARQLLTEFFNRLNKNFFHLWD